ncbi:MAG: helicase HerA domain-containing protein, partial [Haloarculaceae archaeon]
VSLPVVELLTGRGFVTGKSGSGKSNSASVVAEKLLDSGFGLLIVDVDGEYYGLKEEYEILHAGADEECDIQITADHAEKMATLALEKNVPIILDVSSFLDESEAEAVLTAVARHLFAKAKKQKQPFLLLVEEVHEYIPENGSVGECGKMLIKIGKRGRKHGLGMVGISQRPADVKKDFITQCDWLVWHRLTWDNDTKVVRRVLDGEYAAAVEDLDDGEGFLMTDWSGSVRRVQFQRKRTFDAGATPGLDDFERPDLKSVSDDLVSELEEISDQKQARDDRVAELRAELDRKNSRVAELERELEDARNMERMADQFVDALVDHVEGAAPGRTERERARDGTRPSADPIPRGDSGPDAGLADSGAGSEDDSGAEAESDSDAQEQGQSGAQAEGDSGGEVRPAPAAGPQTNGETAPGGAGTGDRSNGDSSEFSAADVLDRLAAVDPDEVVADVVEPTRATPENGGTVDTGTEGPADETSSEDIVEADGDDTEYGILGDEGETADIIEEPLAVRELKADIAGLETTTRRMLAVYRQRGPETPPSAHVAAGGDGDRTAAYAHNRQLRTRGLVEHTGRGHYEYRLRELLRESFGGHADEERVEAYARSVEDHALDVDGVHGAD